MTTKRLYKDKSEKMIAGGCSGVAEYFNIDPTLVRLGWTALVFLAGSGVIAYIIAMIIIPNKPNIIA